MKLLGVGFGNVVMQERILAVVDPDSVPVKRMIQAARDNGQAVDVTRGRETRSAILMDNGYIVLSANQVETITERVNGKDDTKGNSKRKKDE